jgi:CRP/FNR family transcriptional regulator
MAVSRWQGYHMPGEIIGLDGIGTDHHGTEAIALENTEVCVVPFANVQDLARSVPALQRNLHKVMSKEIAQEQSVMLLLGSMRAEERLAAFLLNLSHRYRRRGYSANEYELRMTRKEIGSYLGLTLETVSRLFSRFQKIGLIRVHGRTVKVLEYGALTRLMGQRC